MIYDYNLLLYCALTPSPSHQNSLTPPSIHPSFSASLSPTLLSFSLYTHACTRAHIYTHTSHTTHTHTTHTKPTPNTHNTQHTHTQHPTYTPNTHRHTYLCSFDWQAEADREEHYFDSLEKKEMMEEKMKSITSMEVTVYTCVQVSGHFQVKKALTAHAHSAGQWPVSGQKSTDYTCAQRRSVANVRCKKSTDYTCAQWPMSGEKSTDYTCAQCRSVASVRSKKH